jgi:integrase
VNTPPTLSATGKRERAYFETRDEAKAHAAELRAKFLEHGSLAAAIPPALSEQAVAAAALLEPFGGNLLDAARLWVETRKRNTASCTLADAVDAWRASCKGLRPRTLKSYKQTGDRLKAALAARTLSKLTAKQLAAALGIEGASGSGAAVHYRNGRAFWRWAAEKKWCQAEVFDGVDAPHVETDGEIEILAPPAVQALMRAAEKYAPEAVGHFALLVFAGIRAEEITKLKACHVTTDGVDIPAGVAKKRRRRHITPCATLKAWLEKHPFEPLSEYKWIKAFDRVRCLAGWEVQAGQLEERPKPTRGPWPQNCIRHSHASYSVAVGVPLQALLFEFGHSAKPDVLRSNYVGRASRKQALEFFAIRPTGETAATGPQLETVESPAA